MALVDVLKRIAGRKGATPAQLALAWLLAPKPWIVRRHTVLQGSPPSLPTRKGC